MPCCRWLALSEKGNLPTRVPLPSPLPAAYGIAKEGCTDFQLAKQRLYQVTVPCRLMLRIRDVCRGSRILDPNFSIPNSGTGSPIRIHNTELTKNLLSCEKYDSGCLSRILIFSISDSGSRGSKSTGSRISDPDCFSYY
jgi:hypothetical protein